MSIVSDEDSDDAKSFLLPQFGSVFLLNPPQDLNHDPIHLPMPVLDEPFDHFTQHLYALLSLPTISPKISPCPASSPNTPIEPFAQPLTPWQLEEVMRVRARENSLEARKTLAGITRLVSKIKEMKLGPGVRDMVLGAVQKLEKVNQSSARICDDNWQMDSTLDTREAFILSRDAVILASQAFFDPSMMGLLYFVSGILAAREDADSI